MKTQGLIFSTPLVNPHCPFGLKNPCVIVTSKSAWDASSRLEMDAALDRWMASQGFGELESNIYQADKAVETEAVSEKLTSAGMTHCATLDPLLHETFAEMA